MRKYQAALTESITEQTDLWLRMSPNDTIKAEALHRFLHMIRGTSGVVGLTAVSDTAGVMMSAIEDRTEDWTIRDLRHFLEPLLTAAMAAATSEEPAADVQRPAVVLCNPDGTFLRDLQAYLERRDFRVIAVRGTEEALDAVKRELPDSLIAGGVRAFDGEHDAFGLLERLRAQEAELGSLEIDVTLVAPDEAWDRPAKIRAFRLGADHYAPMPIDMAVLAARMRRQSNRRRAVERMIASARGYNQPAGPGKEDHANG